MVLFCKFIKTVVTIVFNTLKFQFTTLRLWMFFNNIVILYSSPCKKFSVHPIIHVTTRDISIHAPARGASPAAAAS